MPGKWNLLANARKTATWDQDTECPCLVAMEPTLDPTAEKSNIETAKIAPLLSLAVCECGAREQSAPRAELSVSHNRLRHHAHRRHLLISPEPSHIHRLAILAADCASILAGGWATVVIHNFNQSPGKLDTQPLPPTAQITLPEIINLTFSARETCPHPFETDDRWPKALALPTSPSLPCALGYPSVPVYFLALSTYSAAGVFQLLVRQPKYWAECGLLAILASLLAGVLHGGRAMLDALILGGGLSLLCCKAIGSLLPESRNGHRSWQNDQLLSHI
jgi:hypothetical protein